MTVIKFLLKRPMLLTAVCSALTVIISFYSFFSAVVWSILCIIFMFWIIYKKKSANIIFCIIIILCTVFSTFLSLGEIDSKSKLDAVECSGEFLVIENPTLSGKNYGVTAEVLKSDYLEKGDKIYVTYMAPKLSYGECFKGKIKLSNMTDYRGKLSFYSNGIYLFGDAEEIVLLKNTDFVIAAVAQVRQYIESKIFSNMDNDSAATMVALISGDRRYFSDEFYNNVKSSGVAHVMVVSGMHLSIIVSMFLYLINKFIYNRYIKALVIFMVVIIVCGVCGFTMSILRAGITYLLIALSMLLKRQSNSENTLGASVCIILILSPLAVFNIAFQLSVLSTFGILAVAIPIINFVLKNEIIKSKIILALASSVLISLSAMLLTMPVTIAVFGYVSNMAIMTNLLISIPVTFAMCGAIIALIIPLLNNVVFFGVNIIVRYINGVINTFGELPFATTDLPIWASWLSVLIIFLILYVLVACENRNNMLKLKSIIIKKIMEGGKKLKWHSLKNKR